MSENESSRYELIEEKYGSRIREIIESEESEKDPKTLKVRIYQRVLQLLDLWEKRDLDKIKNLQKNYEELVKAEEDLLKKLEKELERVRNKEEILNKKIVEYNEKVIDLNYQANKLIRELNQQILEANKRLGVM